MGRRVTLAISHIGAVLVFSGQTLRWTLSRPFYVKNLLKQMEQIGFNSIPVVLTTALSTGIVLAYQSYCWVQTIRSPDVDRDGCVALHDAGIGAGAYWAYGCR